MNLPFSCFQLKCSSFKQFLMVNILNFWFRKWFMPWTQLLSNNQYGKCVKIFIRMTSRIAKKYTLTTSNTKLQKKKKLPKKNLFKCNEMLLPSGRIFAARHLAKRQAWHWFLLETSTMHFPPSLHVYSRFLLKLNQTNETVDMLTSLCVFLAQFVDILMRKLFWKGFKLTVGYCAWRNLGNHLCLISFIM